MTRAASLGLLTLYALALVQHAAAASGQFTAGATASVEPAATYDGSPHAIFFPNMRESGLVLKAGSAFVCEYTWKRMEADVAALSVRSIPEASQRCYQASNLTITQSDPSKEGWGALDATSGDLHLLVEGSTKPFATGKTTLASESAEVGFFDSRGDEAPATMPDYYRQVTGDHIRLVTTGTGTFAGQAKMKLMGPDLLLESDANATRIRTGESSQRDGVAGPVQQRWVVVDFQDGVLEFRTTELTAALHGAHVETDGLLSFTALDGVLHTDEGPHRVRNQEIQVEGNLLVTLSPKDSHLIVGIFGKIRETSIGSSTVKVTGGDSPPPVFGLLLGAVVGAGVATVVTFRLQNRARTFEECLQRARDAQEAGNYTRALHWNRAVQAKAPKSPIYVMDEAFYLSMIGKTEAALKTYRRAHELSKDGAAAVDAARLAARSGHPPEDIEVFLAEALEKEPSLLDSIEAEFRAMMDRPLWPAISERAAQRLAGGPIDP